MNDDYPSTDQLSKLLSHADWVRRLARRLVEDKSTADDLAQRTWLAALQNSNHEIKSPRAWLRRIMQNLARTMHREDSRRRARESNVPMVTIHQNETSLPQRASILHGVSALFLELEEPYRTAILLRFFEDLSAKEVANRLGCPVETARTRIKRGLHQIATKLDSQSNGSRRYWQLALIPALLSWPNSSPATATSNSIDTTTTKFTSTAAIKGATAISSYTKVAIASVFAAALAVGAWSWSSNSQDSKISEHGSAERRNVRLPRRKGSSANQASQVVRNSPTQKNGRTSLPGEAAMATLHGRVADHKGSPVAHAKVFLCPSEDSHNHLSMLEDQFEQLLAATADSLKNKRNWVVTVTDMDGKYRFTKLARGSKHLAFSISRNLGLTSLYSTIAPHHASSILNLEFQPALTLWGHVLDDQGNPIENARVSLNAQTPDRDPAYAHCFTDKIGRWQLPPVNFPSVRVFAQKEGYFNAPPVKFIFDGVVGRKETNLRLVAAPKFECELVDPNGHEFKLLEYLVKSLGKTVAQQYIEDHKVKLISCFGPPSNDKMASSRGNKGEVDVDAARYNISLTSSNNNYVGLYIGNSVVGSAPLRKENSSPKIVVDTEFFPKPSKHGDLIIRVFDSASGAPLRGFTGHHRVRQAIVPTSEIPFTPKSSDGFAKITGLRVGKYEITIRRPMYTARVVVAEVEALNLPNEIHVHLSKGTAMIQGRVLDAEGNPVFGATVHLFDEKGVVVPTISARSVKSDGEGEFEFATLQEKEYQILVHRHLWAPSTAVVLATKQTIPFTIQLEEGERISLVSRRRTLAPVVVLKILDANGDIVVDDAQVRREGRPTNYVELQLKPGSYSCVATILNSKKSKVNFLVPPKNPIQF